MDLAVYWLYFRLVLEVKRFWYYKLVNFPNNNILEKKNVV